MWHQVYVSVKQGKKTWRDVFSDSCLRTDALGDVIAAMELAEDERFAEDAIVQACHKFIREGDEACIPILRDLLTLYGNRLLAEDYMNCGQPYLRVVGEAWARAHGYKTVRGQGSNRVRWCSAR